MDEKKKNKIAFITFAFISLFVILYIFILEKLLNYPSCSLNNINSKCFPTSNVILKNLKYILPICILYLFTVISYFVLKVKNYFKFFLPILLMSLIFLALEVSFVFKGNLEILTYIFIVPIFLWWIFPVSFLIGLNLDEKYKLSIQNNNENISKINYEAIFGFVISFIILPFAKTVSLILSIIGIIKSKKEGIKGKKIAIAGIIICSVQILLYFLVAFYNNFIN